MPFYFPLAHFIFFFLCDVKSGSFFFYDSGHNIFLKHEMRFKHKKSSQDLYPTILESDPKMLNINLAKG